MSYLRHSLVVLALHGACARSRPAQSEITVAATDTLSMRVPRSATPIVDAPVGDGSESARGYEIPSLSAQLLVQYSPLAGTCDAELAAQEEAFRTALADNEGLRHFELRRRLIAGVNTMLTLGKLRAAGDWRGIASIATCKDTSFLVVTATSLVGSDASTIAQLRQLATRAVESLEVATGIQPAPTSGTDSVRVSTPWKLTVALPRGVRSVSTNEDGVLYEFPGVSGFAIHSLESFSNDADCARYLDVQQASLERDLEEGRDPEQAKSMRAVTEHVERDTSTGMQIVIRLGRQIDKKGNWYANTGATVCKNGEALNFTAVSFEGENPEGKISPDLYARLRTTLLAIVPTLAPL